MIPRPPLPPEPHLVVGLARSGVAAAEALVAAGRAVVGVDGRAVPDAVRARLGAAGVPVHAPADGLGLLEHAGSVVKSPGVPAQAPVVAAARAGGVPVLGELELGWRLVPGPVVAVTGSNGKTTTTELLAAIHRAAGIPVAAAGNVGTPLSSLAGTDVPGRVIVVEASSFQLEDATAFAPEAAVLLNLAPDHLDRHGTFAAYRAAKLRIFAHQPAGAVAVVPAALAGGLPAGPARRITFGAAHGDVHVAGGMIVWQGEPVMAAEEVRLRGAHNLENALAAAAVALARGIEPGAVGAALSTFAGVAHRLEEVGTHDGVLYVNDSKATNVASALVGIASFPAGVHVILGGSPKGEDYAPLAPVVAAHCRGAYLIGHEGPAIGAALAGTGVPVRGCGDLERAVGAARAAAAPGDVILLSPACASFDQFADYEERGAAFRALASAT
jgi:UDP-N-acetylmuramoylalanine--D-glutamate ligase